MDINQIKNELRIRGWTYADLAARLHVSPGSLGNVLSGVRPMTEQLAAHIELLFEGTREVVFVYSVEIPDGVVRKWIPSWDELTDTQKESAARRVFTKFVQDMAEEGIALLSDDDRRLMYRPADDPSGDLRAADYGDSEHPFA